MSDDRKPYKVKIGGTEHTLLLNSEDAARYTDAKPVTKAADKPADKSRTTKNK